MKILHIAYENSHWRQARSTSFPVQLGLREALRSRGHEVLTLTSQYARRAPELLRGKHFDQVWFDLVMLGGDELGPSWIEFISKLAPVRLGLMAESLEYEPAALQAVPALVDFKPRALQRLPYLTHVLAGDEKDVATLQSQGLPTLWWVCSVPRRLAAAQAASGPGPIRFFGDPYGARQLWLEDPNLVTRMGRQPSTEAGTHFPRTFDSLQTVIRLFTKLRLPGYGLIRPPYIEALSRLRQWAYARWLTAMRRSGAVISLPSHYGAYPGRVSEAMASGRPCLAWDIPDRPRNRALFEEGREILRFSDPEELANRIDQIVSDPVMAKAIAERALRKLVAYHTTERRVDEILHFLATGKEPGWMPSKATSQEEDP